MNGKVLSLVGIYMKSIRYRLSENMHEHGKGQNSDKYKIERNELPSGLFIRCKY